MNRNLKSNLSLNILIFVLVAFLFTINSCEKPENNNQLSNSNFGLGLKFNTESKSLTTDESGMPDSIKSFSISVYKTIAGDFSVDSKVDVKVSSCIKNKSGGTESTEIKDVPVSISLTFVFEGYTSDDCSGVKSWKGESVLVSGQLVEGKNYELSIFVSQLGISKLANELDTGIAFHSATNLDNGKILLAGGFSKLSNVSNCDGSSTDCTASMTAVNKAYLYNPTTGSLSETGSLSDPRALHHAVKLPDGKILFSGGVSAARFNQNSTSKLAIIPSVNAAVLSLEVFDPDSDSGKGAFIKISSQVVTSTPRALHTISQQTIDNKTTGRVFIIGGDLINNTSLSYEDCLYSSENNVVCSDFSTNSGTYRVGHTATVLNSGILLFGGNSLEDSTNGVFAELLNYNTNIVKPEFVNSINANNTNSWNLAVRFHTANKVGNKVYIIGGIAAVEDGTNNWTAPLTNGYIVDVSNDSNSWALSQISLKARALHTATVLRNGTSILVAGGLGSDYSTESNLEIVSDSASEVLVDSTLLIARYGHSATLLSDGSVLIVGGFEALSGNDDQNAITSIELFNTDL